MNTFMIALKEMKHDLRDKRTFWLMLAFPIALMLVLGFALTNAFDTGTNVDEIKVIVKDVSGGSRLGSVFAVFAPEAEQAGVSFETVPAGTDGRSEVGEGRYAAYVEVKPDEIVFYGSSGQSIESQIVQGMLAVFTDRYKTSVAVESAGPGRAAAAFAETAGSGGYIKETSVDADRKPGAMDYYAVAMSIMIAMYSALSANSLIRREVANGTMNRLSASPVGKSEIFAGKVLGNIVMNALCVYMLVFISKFALNAYWGDHIGLVLAVLLTEVVFAVSFGLAVSYLMKGKASFSLTMLIVQLAAFFGGSYFPLGEGGEGPLSALVGWSPIRWANRALTQLIYENGVTAAWNVMAVNIALSVLLLAISAAVMRRKEGI